MQNLALIKLGGSVITFKDQALKANMEAIDGISKALAGLDVPVIVVHGGGSFGHHWSVQYDMHTKPDAYDPHGVSVVHESMITLNQIIVNSMIRSGMNPYSVAPPAFTTGHRPIPSKIRQLYVMAKSKVTPVTFGDVVHVEGSKYSILSGDALMSVLARVLRPSKVVFATNVDGIYKDMQTKELVRELKLSRAGKIEFSKVAGADVTGGMQRKVKEAFKIASLGLDVMLINGLKPDRISQAVTGKLEMGTMVKGRR